jgi:hypothetical protein
LSSSQNVLVVAPYNMQVLKWRRGCGDRATTPRTGDCRMQRAGDAEVFAKAESEGRIIARGVNRVRALRVEAHDAPLPGVEWPRTRRL